MKKLLSALLFFFAAASAYTQNPFDTDETYVMRGKQYHLSTRDLGDEQEKLLLTVVSEGKTILKCKKDKSIGGWSLEDFDGDGYLDIRYDYFGGTSPELYLFDGKKNRYIKVKGFERFTEAQPVKARAGYYYSYSKAGCADMNWTSNLFEIVNYKTIHLGHIYGKGCPHVDGEGDIPKIYVYKILNNDSKKEKLFRTVSFEGKSFQSADDKWDFIDKFWSKYYQLF